MRLSEHASTEERREVFRRHRPWLLGIGVLTRLPRAPHPASSGLPGPCSPRLSSILVPLAIWIYTLVFAFASLWFAHYCLAALEQLRAEPRCRGAAPRSALRRR